jgi:hypothetical protein
MKSAETSFISSTNWTECIGFVAALETIKILEETDAHDIIDSNGQKMKAIWEKVYSESFKIPVEISGVNSLPVHNINIEHINPLELETYITIELLKRGVLGFKQFKPSAAHRSKDFLYYENVLYDIVEELYRNDFNFSLNSPVRHSGFQRLTRE